MGQRGGSESSLYLLISLCSALPLAHRQAGGIAVGVQCKSIRLTGKPVPQLTMEEGWTLAGGTSVGVLAPTLLDLARLASDVMV